MVFQVWSAAGTWLGALSVISDCSHVMVFPLTGSNGVHRPAHRIELQDWRRPALQQSCQAQTSRCLTCVVRAYGKPPGSGIDNVRQIIAQETSEGKGGFGPPPPEGRSKGRGFINLSYRDTGLQDGYEEASRSLDDEQEDPSEPTIRLKTVPEDLTVNPHAPPTGTGVPASQA